MCSCVVLMAWGRDHKLSESDACCIVVIFFLSLNLRLFSFWFLPPCFISTWRKDGEVADFERGAKLSFRLVVPDGLVGTPSLSQS